MKNTFNSWSIHQDRFCIHDFSSNHHLFLIALYVVIAPSLSQWARREHSESHVRLPHLMNHEDTYTSEISCVTVLFSVAIATVLVHDRVCSHLDSAGSLLNYIPAVSLSFLQSILYTLIIKASTYWALTTCTIANTLYTWPTLILITIVIFNVINTEGITAVKETDF